LSRPQIRKFHSRVVYNIPEYHSIRSKTRDKYSLKTSSLFQNLVVERENRVEDGLLQAQQIQEFLDYRGIKFLPGFILEVLDGFFFGPGFPVGAI
jgi:hypothetical protein